MAPTGEEIRSRLSAFAARWSVYEGGERSEETNRRLLELNRAIAAGEVEYHPFD